MGQRRQVWVIGAVGIALSLGLLAVLTVLWFVVLAKPLPIRVERREVVATVAGRAVLVGPSAALAAGGEMTAQVNLGRVEAALVRPGDEVALTFDKMQRTVLHGRVTQVAEVPALPWPVYQVLIRIPMPGGAPAAQPLLGTTAGGGIGPGLSADAIITVGRVAGALAVPNDALVRGARGEFSVAVLRQGEWRMIPVQVGLLGDHYTQTRRGLREGEIVRLTPGVPGAR